VVEDEENVLEEDLSDEEADSASAGPVQWVVVPAWEVLANDRVGWRGGLKSMRANGCESGRVEDKGVFAAAPWGEAKMRS
jgi:hypothetical protein